MTTPRSPYRRFWRWCAIIFGSFFFLVFVGLIYSFTLEGKQQRKPLVKPYVWSKTKFNSPRNPYQHYDKAIKLLSPIDVTVVEAYIQQQYPYSQLNQSVITKEQLHRALDALQPAIEELHRGARCHGNAFEAPYKRKSAYTVFPEYAHMRALARVTTTSAIEKMSAGKCREGVRDVLAAYEMGADIQKGDSILISALVSLAVKATALRPLQYAMDDKTLKAADYILIVQELERIDNEQVPYRKIMEGEYIFTRGTLYEILSMTTPKQLQAYLDDWGGNSSEMFLYLSLPGMKSRTIINFENAWQTILANSNKAYPEGSKLDESTLIPRSDLVNSMLFPAMSQFMNKYALNQSITRGVILMAALEAFRLERGNYPASLSELVSSGYIKKQPTDPFTLGKPFQYQHQGKSYLLYSIGPDLTDDSGMAQQCYKINAPHTGDIVFTPGIDAFNRLPRKGTVPVLGKPTFK